MNSKPKGKNIIGGKDPIRHEKSNIIGEKTLSGMKKDTQGNAQKCDSVAIVRTSEEQIKLA